MSRVLPAGAGLAGRGETRHGLREHRELASLVENTENTGEFPQRSVCSAAAPTLCPRSPWFCHGLLALAAVLALPAISQAQAAVGTPDAGGMPAPTVALERGRTVYVLNTCHFCHGVDLTKATMGAAELMRSALVGADDNGNVIGAIVRAGIPNLQTSMPSYPDLTQQEVVDLAAYIHFLRQAGRHRQLTAAPLGGGDAAAGGRAFGAQCASCHAGRADKTTLIAAGDASTIKTRFLGPPPPASEGTDHVATGRRQHLKLIEQLSETDMNDLVAYLLNRRR